MHFLEGGQHPFVVFRDDADKFRQANLPGGQNPLRQGAVGIVRVVLDQRLDGGDFFRLSQFLQRDHILVAVLGESAVFIEDIGNPARHAGRKIASGAAEDDHAAAGHVFAAMIADPFHDRVDAAVPDAETFPGPAAQVSFAAGAAIERHIAGDDTFLGGKSRAGRGINDDFPTRKAFAEVIVGIALEQERQPAGDEGAQTLTGRALEFQADGIVGQTGGAVATGDLAA